MRTPRNCEGEGSGWGTIEDVTLHPLLLSGPSRAPLAELTAQALGRRHRPTLVVRGGLFPGIDAARAGHEIHPELVHAFGREGAASAAPKVAAGLDVPLLLSLDEADVAGPLPRRLRQAIEGADAVILTTGKAAELLRAAEIKRDLYVIAEPNAAELPTYFGALEVVYGRVLAGTELDYEPPAPAQGAPALVQLGGLKKSRPE